MHPKNWPSETKRALILLSIGAIVLSAAWHFGSIVRFFSIVFDILTPAILGFTIAFILNVPMSKFERLFAKIQTKRQKPVREQLNTILALILTLALTISVLALIIGGILPHLINSVKTATTAIYKNYPHALDYLEKRGIETDWIRDMMASFNLKDLLGSLQENLSQILRASYSAINSILSTLFLIFTSFILAIYMLGSKHRIQKQLNRLLSVSVKERYAEKIRLVLRVAYRCFSNFIAGQCLEACILGIMFMMVLSVMQIPYAFLLSILIAVTAIIPFVGAFIGFFVGAVIILFIDPFKVLVFAITFLVVQQLEEQLIYPRVVGKSVGLPPVWTLLAVLIGGQIGGVVGVLVFIPLTATVYALTKEFVVSKEKKQDKTENSEKKPLALPSKPSVDHNSQ